MCNPGEVVTGGGFDSRQKIPPPYFPASAALPGNTGWVVVGYNPDTTTAVIIPRAQCATLVP
jgi:hypothetical protein